MLRFSHNAWKGGHNSFPLQVRAERHKAKEAAAAKATQLKQVQAKRAAQVSVMATTRLVVEQKARLQTGWKPKVGDRVLVPTMQREGVVAKLMGKRVLVSCGTLSVDMRIRDIVKM